MSSKNVVVLGGGFAGLNAALNIHHQTPETKITLIDKEDYHLYYPNLYEVASSEEDFVDIRSLKRSVALPFAEILPKKINFIQGKVASINTSGDVEVDGKKIPFDYLIVALGSVPDCFGIEGLEENSLPMRGVNDALRIKNEIELMYQMHEDVLKKQLRIVIGGGGFTGVELTGELLNLLEILNWKYNYPKEKVELMIIEGMGSLLPGLDSEVGKNIYDRLTAMGVNVRLNNLITKVDKNQIHVNTGEMINFDLMIWTGGIKCAPLPFTTKVELDKKGRCIVDEYLAIPGTNVYLIGDNASVMRDGKPIPQTATQAIYAADYVSCLISAKIWDCTAKKYVPKDFPYIIPVRGKWAVMHTPDGEIFYGLFPWLMHIGAALRYFTRLVGPFRALKFVFFETKLYMRND